MSPADFNHTLLDEAWRMRQSVIAQTRHGNPLDRATSLWVITLPAWQELRRHADYSTEVDVFHHRLFGLPVRITIEDAPDTPMIQLLMEPQLHARITQ